MANIAAAEHIQICVGAYDRGAIFGYDLVPIAEGA